MKHPFIAVTLSLCLSFLFVVESRSQTLYITTEELPPRNFMKDGKIAGLGSEQVFEIMKRAGVDYKVELMPWTRAISLAESEDNTCAYSTLHTDARDGKFKWVEPLDQENIILVKKKGNPINPANEEEAKKLSVGVQTKSAPYDVAVKHGFSNLELVANYDMIVNKLVADRNDLAIVSKSSAMSYLNKGEIEQIMVIEPKAVGLACNKNIPDEVIQKLNASLSEIIKDGTQEKIKTSYSTPPSK